MRRETNWYVISGGPACGKTTLLQALKTREYKTVPEQARLFVDTELATGKTLEEIHKDEQKFQQTLLRMQIDVESRLSLHQTTFLDRGIPDMAAYYRFHRIPEDALLTEALRTCSYKKVFMLDLLPLVPDYARSETIESQHTLHELIFETYRALPFPIVQVPILPPEERVAFVIERL